MAMGFSAVLLYGAPTHQVGTYAVFRAVDVVIGGLIAAGVAKFVLPVVPQLTKRRGPCWPPCGGSCRHRAA